MPDIAQKTLWTKTAREKYNDARQRRDTRSVEAHQDE